MHALLTWFHSHGHGLAWGAGLSILFCVVGLLATPWLVARIPDDYFSAVPRPLVPTGPGHWSKLLLVILKNLVGFALLALGLAMIVLPGPGVLTIVIGLVLVDVPGKHRLMAWMLSRQSVLKSINAMRERRGRAPLQPPTGH